ncbi:hypothetical protein [Criblamydia sequanensis]|uniref:Transposase remnant n=1 Tax=Candidatus Criblamydia sequanensis CRIB-18 TaxID=1437425 RepID=A0A090CZZ3_9BACT|nr:hypothetical protein [Criblamydia sequanensis]CDR34611.1 Putative transposase remnant [Criblamydia sequanensis CRIB-18]
MSPKLCSLAFEEAELETTFEEDYSDKVVTANFAPSSYHATNKNSSISEDVILVCGRINVSF